MNSNFAENLKRIRKENNLSQEQLAEELGVSRQAISKWESQVAYPEMDKIIALCNKFNLNIDDLLNKDIREVKGEEETKKNLNKYIDDFLSFITNTINLFINMNFKSKIRFLFEEILIGVVLLVLGLIIYSFGEYIFHSLIWMLPEKLYLVINSLLDSLLIILLVVIAIIIFIHIFKTRYLDYYEKIKQDDFNNEDKEDINTEKEINMVDEKNKEKIQLKNNENKIIIRDPKHSEYRFVNGLFKFIIAIIKIFASWATFLLCLLLILFASLFIVTFLVYKTGFLFLGLTGISLSLIAIDVILILLLFNFIFDRKNDKKKMIWSFISSLVILGISLGFVFVGSLSLEIIDNSSKYLKTDYLEYDMNKNLFFDTYLDIEYIESDIENVKVEYTINENFSISSVYHGNGGIAMWAYCSNPIGIIKNVVDDLNDKTILLDSDGFNLNDIKIYASKENIKILKKNSDDHYSVQKKYENAVEEYEQKINEYSIEISDLEEKIERYEEELNMYYSNRE